VIVFDLLDDPYDHGIEIRTAEEARDLAIQWQHWANEQSLSWAEVGDWANFFHSLGERFGLTEEFVENGVC
jgi:hypothetical protein